MSAPQVGPADITFRPAAANDWPRIAEIVSDSLDGSDYINLDIWHEWVADPDAKIQAALREEQIVAFARLAELGPAEWWLEAVRVARSYQGQGIGRVLLAHMLEQFAQVGIGLLRFATSSKNEVMLTLGREFGFHALISYAPSQAPAEPIDYRKFKLLQPQNLDIAYHYMRRSPMNRVNHFAEHRQTLYYITQERLSQYLAAQDIQVLGWREREHLTGLAIVFPISGQEDAMRLGYLDAADDTTAYAMLAALRGVAARRGFTRVLWKMPIGIGLERRIASTGFVRARDYDLCLYERPLRL